jgi:D-glycero-alpha-D-manno-heptose 1-phosphate guanylyltransferase
MSSGQQPVTCLILVGGLGSRLRPLISEMPKPMAPIGGRPFLEYLVRWVGASGFDQVVLCVGYRAAQIEQYFRQGEGFDVKIAYSVESEPLGTWGAVRQAMERFPGQMFLVLNGDSFLQIELQALLDFHRQRQALASLAVLAVNDSSRFGSIRLAADGRIREFSEKGGEGPALINGGVYCLSREMLRAAPASAASLEKDIFPAITELDLYGFPVHGYFIDIGIPQDYQRLAGDAENWIRSLKLQFRGEKKC